MTEIYLATTGQQGGDAAVEGTETEQQNDDPVDDVGNGLEVSITILKAVIGGAGNQIGGNQTKACHAHAEQAEDAIEHDGVGANQQTIANPEDGKSDAAEQ